MIYALVVIYNKACEISETLKSLYKWKNDIQIIVFDNSTKDNENEAYCEREGMWYFTENINLGLSKAYNYVIERLPLKEDDYIIILDDDTELNDRYITEVLESVGMGKDILLPIVRCGEAILSPNNIKFKCGSKTIKSVDELQQDHMSAINSGMVVSARVYKKMLYNEQLFLDCIDHEFMRMARKNECTMHVLSSIIEQNFSRAERPGLESALFRFKLFKKDFRKYCEMNEAMLYYHISIWKFVVAYTIKYRTLQFLCLNLQKD